MDCDLHYGIYVNRKGQAEVLTIPQDQVEAWASQAAVDKMVVDNWTLFKNGVIPPNGGPIAVDCNLVTIMIAAKSIQDNMQNTLARGAVGNMLSKSLNKSLKPNRCTK